MNAGESEQRLTADALTGKRAPRDYQAVRWNEPLIFGLHNPGHRGLHIPPADGGGGGGSPEDRVRRRDLPLLPEIGQPQVLRHFLRLSQETLGADLNVDIGQGTCTMKYSPKINERFVRAPCAADLHPLQPASTVQGMLAILGELEAMLAEITGMAGVCLQPGAGSAAIFLNVKLVQAYHRGRGESHRDEVVTTIFSHPSNAAAARTAGYRVVTLYPGNDGLIRPDSLAAVLSERTAALLITNPEDTGIFNPRITDLVNAVHAAGGLAVYDQANANGLLGITRAGDADFDLCHLNLHKTFSTPHACGGPASGVVCAAAGLVPFLPGPRLVRPRGGAGGAGTAGGAGEWTFADAGPLAVAPSRPFYGVTPNLLRAYAWIRALGASGLREVAEIAILNNNYLMREVLKLDGVSAPFAAGHPRIEQVRYSWQELTERTGVTSAQLGQRLADYGLHYWTSHHPHLVPQPATFEPTESYSRAELDEYVAALRQTVSEARDNPGFVRAAPHRAAIAAIDDKPMSDPETWAASWRAYRRKYLGERFPQPPRWTPPPGLPVPDRPPRATHR